MSGPALRVQRSHHSIHEAALKEAFELTHLLSRSFQKQEYEKALQIAYIAVEHWETRTLRHAESEESGLYQEWAKKSRRLKENVIALTRDHDLMRLLANEIKQILERDGMSREIIKRFEALILIDTLHNREEEKLLQQ